MSVVKKHAADLQMSPLQSEMARRKLPTRATMATTAAVLLLSEMVMAAAAPQQSEMVMSQLK